MQVEHPYGEIWSDLICIVWLFLIVLCGFFKMNHVDFFDCEGIEC